MGSRPLWSWLGVSWMSSGSTALPGTWPGVRSHGVPRCGPVVSAWRRPWCAAWGWPQRAMMPVTNRAWSSQCRLPRGHRGLAPRRRRARSRSTERGCAASRTRCAPRRPANGLPTTPRSRLAPASYSTATPSASRPAASERWGARPSSRLSPPRTSTVPLAPSPARRTLPGPTVSTCPARSIPSIRRWRPASVKWWRPVPPSPSVVVATRARARR